MTLGADADALAAWFDVINYLYGPNEFWLKKFM